MWQGRQLSLDSQVVGDEPWRQLVNNLRGRLGLKRTVELREYSQPNVPLTWGLIRPMVLLPRQARTWAEQMRRAVLLHELAHVQRRDVAYQLLGRVACSLYWFHPLAWFGLRRLRQEREQACDDAVIHSGEQATNYAEQLLEVARLYHRPSGLSLAVEMARGGSLEQRLQALFDSARSHSPLSRKWAVISLAAMLLLAIIVAVFRPVPWRTLAAPSKNATGQIVLEKGPLKHAVKVVDAQGRPVVGAKLIRLGFGTSTSSGMSWLNDWPKDFVTNDDGLVVIGVPDVSAVKALGEGGIVGLYFTIKHPKYPTKRGGLRWLDDRKPVTLDDSLQLTIHVVRAGDEKPVTTNLVLQTSDFTQNPPSLKNDAWVVDALSPNDPDGGRYLRVIHAPTGQPAWYSDLIDLKQHFPNGGAGQLNVTLHPGVRVKGKLADDVPRPVTSGTVAAHISDGAEQHGWNWEDVTRITAEGDFVFESLPRETNLQLIAVCDGWVSQSPTEGEQNEYSRQYGLSLKARDKSDSTVHSRFFRLSSDGIRPVLSMERTDRCEVTVVDSSAQPMKDVWIGFSPNQFWSGFGGNLVGAGWSSLERLTNGFDPDTLAESPWQKDSFAHFGGKTDSDGRAVIRGLPVGWQGLSVEFEGYELVRDPKMPLKDWRPFHAHVIIQPGEMTRTKVILRRKS